MAIKIKEGNQSKVVPTFPAGTAYPQAVDDSTLQMDSNGTLSLKGSKVTFGTATPTAASMVEGEVYFKLS